MSEAAHRTPPGKDAGGTEINPSPYKTAYYAVDITFFQQQNHHQLILVNGDSFLKIIISNMKS
ncbi:hypothetical protein [Lysinibacillus sp. FSL L8-0126]|uniref:hypothetical protein n=1 Tax=Lysinibacillus sp. FSL L8-0126 TaxID=2921515 RepID=UPI003159C8CA